MNSGLAIITGIFVAIPASQASVLFSQDFETSGQVSDYVSNNPTSGQWNAITSSGSGVSFEISAGKLRFTRETANTGSFSRITDFEPEPLALIYRFDLTVSGNSAAQTTAATWQVGSGFGTGNTLEANAKVHSRFGLNFGPEPGAFSVRDIGAGSDSVLFSGTQQITWIINNSGADLDYLGPDDSLATVGDDKWDLWIGSALALDERSATASDMPLLDLKFIFNRGTGAVEMDNFRIDAIPEPRPLLLGMFLAALFVSGKRLNFGLGKVRSGKEP
jgi:hypothetical protein